MSASALFNIQTEIRLLIIALSHQDPAMRSKVITLTKPDYFGSPEGTEIRTRIDTLIQAGKGDRIPETEDFSEDASLSDAARTALKLERQLVLQASVAPVSTIDALLDQLDRFRKKRVIVNGARQAVAAVQRELDDDSLNEAEATVEQILTELRLDNERHVISFGEGCTKEEALEEAREILLPNEENRLIPTGLAGLDQHIGGFMAGDLVVISGARGGGKTALAAQMQINQYKAQHSVGVVQLEMGKGPVRERIMSNLAGVPHSLIRMKKNLTDAQRNQAAEAWLRFKGLGAGKGFRFQTWITGDPFYTPYKIETDLGLYGYDVIYIDYLTLFDTRGQELWKAQKEYSRYLKKLAQKLGCIIVVLTQLSDDDRVKYGRGPEEDADWWIWWRYGEEERATGNVEIRLDKARHGEACIIPAEFQLAYMRVETSGPLVGAALMSSAEIDQEKRKGSKKRKNGKGNRRPTPGPLDRDAQFEASSFGGKL